MFHLFFLHVIVKANISKPNIVIQKIPAFWTNTWLTEEALLNDVIKNDKNLMVLNSITSSHNRKIVAYPRPPQTSKMKFFESNR